MGPHEGGDDGLGRLPAQPVDDAEHPQLRLDVQAVAALDLDRRGPVEEGGVQEGPGERE